MSDLKPETLEVPDRVRRQIEALQSALTEALDALDKYSTEQGRIIAARIRSQIEGSKPIPDMFRMSRSFPEGRIEGSNDG